VEVDTTHGEDVTGDGGVLKKILVSGEGTATPKKGAEVSVHYVGTLTDGSKFDSSRDRDEPFEFTLGNGGVIKGWDTGVATMKKGEKSLFTIRSDYGYGENGSPPKIPGGATLIFEIELLSWISEKDITLKKDGGIMKSVISEGKDWQTPKDDEKITAIVTGILEDGTIFEPEHQINVLLGEEVLPEGLEKAIVSMKKGERSSFKIRSDYAFGATGNPDKKIPPSATLTYNVTLLEWEGEKNSWEMSVQEKLDSSTKRKNEGNERFKVSKYELALKKYQKALGYINSDYDFKTDEEKAQAKAHKIPILLNTAQVYYKQQDYLEAANNCGKVLDLDKANVKALFRRGQSYLSLAEFEKAKTDLEAALEHDKDNKEIIQSLAQLKRKIKEQDQKDKKLYTSMFSAIGKD